MIAGSHDEVDFRLCHVGLLTVEVELILELVKPPVMLDHSVVGAGGRVKVCFGVVFDQIGSAWPVERSPHAGDRKSVV